MKKSRIVLLCIGALLLASMVMAVQTGVSTDAVANLIASSSIKASYATANTVAYFDANKFLISTGVSPTTLGYMDATSSVQGQLNALAPADSPTFTTEAIFDYATANTVGYFDAQKHFVSSAVSPTTLGYVDATSSIQGQLNALAPLDSPSFTTEAIFGYATANTVGYFDAQKHFVSSAVSPTTLGYLDATSSIQGQLNAKAPSTAPTFATSITASYATASTLACFDATKQIVSCSPSIHAGANTACTTTCTGHGFVIVAWDTAVTPVVVPENDATADLCYCSQP